MPEEKEEVGVKEGVEVKVMMVKVKGVENKLAVVGMPVVTKGTKETLWVLTTPGCCGLSSPHRVPIPLWLGDTDEKSGMMYTVAVLVLTLTPGMLMVMEVVFTMVAFGPMRSVINPYSVMAGWLPGAPGGVLVPDKNKTETTTNLTCTEPQARCIEGHCLPGDVIRVHLAGGIKANSCWFSTCSCA